MLTHSDPHRYTVKVQYATVILTHKEVPKPLMHWQIEEIELLDYEEVLHVNKIIEHAQHDEFLAVWCLQSAAYQALLAPYLTFYVPDEDVRPLFLLPPINHGYVNYSTRTLPTSLNLDGQEFAVEIAFPDIPVELNDQVEADLRRLKLRALIGS